MWEYHKYCRGCSVPWGNIIKYVGLLSIPLAGIMISSQGTEHENMGALNISHDTDDILTCILIFPRYSKYFPIVLKISLIPLKISPTVLNTPMILNTHYKRCSDHSCPMPFCGVNFAQALFVNCIRYRLTISLIFSENNWNLIHYNGFSTLYSNQQRAASPKRQIDLKIITNKATTGHENPYKWYFPNSAGCTN